MQHMILNQESLEDEIVKKVDLQYDNLKSIIDEQKAHAKSIIRNLESVQDYQPPPQDFTNKTLDELSGFQEKIEKNIQELENLNSAKNYLQVLE